MPTYHRRTRVAAPLESVWDFHSRITGLEALTPGWMGLSVERVRGADGEENPDVLDVGSRVEMSLRPFGVGPKQSWVSRIVERERNAERAVFRDDMVGGPFRRWVHTHEFAADGDGTIVDDTVEYELPGGDVGAALGPFARVGFEPMFRYRHRRTKELLEDAV
ncbi:SRPBCC family protein [Halegenticoccus tardaugens]|uniref:SRPBCC family protein n=1 Tax=Halegenticoccus tardaugens TaxID=2071624 RepID=UPI00100AECEA|nr:SRPBCC family protein [Halegenticoccus tardaugens]